MNIPSRQKIKRQVQAYVMANLPKIESNPAYKELNSKIGRTEKKFSHIRKNCERTRRNVSECNCKSHPDYLAFVNELEPLTRLRDKIVAEWLGVKKKLEVEHESLLLRSLNAKLKYIERV